MGASTLPVAPTVRARFFGGDVWHSFRSSPVAIGAAAVAAICIFCAAFAGWVAPHNPFDLATLELSDSMLPPAWMAGGQAEVPARHRRAGPGCAVGAHVRRPHLAAGRRCIGSAVVADRRHARTGVRLLWGTHRRADHADLRRDAVISVDPDCAVDRGSRSGDVPECERLAGVRCADHRHRAARLGAVRARGPRFRHGRAQQGICAGRPGHRRLARCASWAATCCRMCSDR